MLSEVVSDVSMKWQCVLYVPLVAQVVQIGMCSAKYSNNVKIQAVFFRTFISVKHDIHMGVLRTAGPRTTSP